MDLLVEFGGRVRVVHVIAVRDVLHAQIEQPWGPADGGRLRGHPKTLLSPRPKMPDAGQPEQQGAKDRLWEPRGAISHARLLPLNPRTYSVLLVSGHSLTSILCK